MDDMKGCCNCKINCLKSNFYRNVNKKAGINSICKVCMKNYIKEYMKNRVKTDVNFRLIRNTRRRIHHALNGRSKSSSTRDILGIEIETYKRWIKWQMAPDMTWENIEIDHVRPISSFDISDDEQLKEAFNWRNTHPFLEESHQKKGIMYNFLDYKLQFIKTCQFLKINGEGLN